MSQKATSHGRAAPPAKTAFPVWIVAVIAVVIVAVGAAIVLTRPQAQSAPATPLPPTISVTDAAAKRDAGAFILDVREPSEWVQYHVPGSTLIPLGTLASRVNELPKNKDIVVVCHSGNRSAQGRDILLKAGLTRVTSMSGGLVAWGDQNLPLAQGQ